jgi:hypothetical protein
MFSSLVDLYITSSLAHPDSGEVAGRAGAHGFEFRLQEARRGYWLPRAIFFFACSITL